MNLAKKGTIISIKEIAKRTVEVAIKVPEDFNFIAGQYIWLMIPELKYPDKRGNTRMWSIASSPNRKGELDIIFRISESGYKKTLVEMTSGSEIIFSGPYGHMVLPEDLSLPVILIAGGVGVTPFLSTIRFSNETYSGHKITLVYVNNNKGEAVYLDELAQTEKDNPNFKLFSVLGSLRESQLKKSVNGHIKEKAIWAVAGPQGFVDFVGRYLNERGVPVQDIIFEEFYPHLFTPPPTNLPL